MENGSDFTKEEDPPGRNKQDATEKECLSLFESEITGVSKNEEGMVNDSEGVLEKKSALSHYVKGMNNTEGTDRLVGKIEENVTARVASVDRLDETQRREFRFEPGSSDRLIQSKTTNETDGRKHRRPSCDIISKQTQRRVELKKLEGDLRQRLDILECSMPAVMMLKVCKMAQGASACKIKRILEKQFEAASELPCRSTPSRHYDSRVRETEAARKLALKKVEEARVVWTKKLEILEERKKRVEEARKVQEEQKNTMERLNEEIRVMRETMGMKKMNELCDCGDAQCRWLSKMSSVTSIQSGDIQCLEKLQQLAEEEMIMKRDITELERREDAYMRTLQQTEELWLRMEGDGDDSTTNVLREQLNMKIAANQQLADRVCELEDSLEKCRIRMNACRTELEKFLSIEKLEAAIGRDDDIALVTDKKIAVKTEVVHKPIGRLDDVATVEDIGELAKVEVVDEEALAKIEAIDEVAIAKVEMVDEEALAKVEEVDEEALAKVEEVDEEAIAKVEVTDEETLAIIPLTDADTEMTFIGDDKWVSVKPSLVELAVDRQVDLVPVKDEESIVRQVDFDYEQQKFEEVRKYLAELGSLEELYKDGEACPPDIVCNDEVSSPTGMTDEELIALGVEPDETAKKVRGKLVPDKMAPERQFEDEVKKVADDVSDDVAEKDEVVAEQIPDAEIKQVVMKEKAANDKPLEAPEKRRFKAGQDIIIKRDEILSWIDRIDTIRTKTREREVKKEADILAEQIGAHIGIKPREVILDEADGELDREEIEFMPELTAELDKIDPIATIQIKRVTPQKEDAMKVETEDKLTELEEKKKESVTQKLSPTVRLEEISTEVDSTREKISADAMEPFKTVPMETSRVERIELYDETAKSMKEEKTLITQEVERKKEEIIPEHLERIEIKVEGVSEEEVMKAEQEPHAEILETKEHTRAPPVAERKEMEATNAKEVEPTEFAKETPIVIEKKEIERIDIKEIASTEYTEEAPFVTEKEEVKDIDTEKVIEYIEEAQPIQGEEEIKVVTEKDSPVAEEKEVDAEILLVAKEEEVEKVDTEKIPHLAKETEIEIVDAKEIPQIKEEREVEKVYAEEIPQIAGEAEVDKTDVEEIPLIAKEREMEQIDAEEILQIAEKAEMERIDVEEIPLIAKEKEMEQVDAEEILQIAEEAEIERIDVEEIPLIAKEREMEQVDAEEILQIEEEKEVEKIDVEKIPLIEEEKEIDKEEIPPTVEEVHVEEAIPSEEMVETEPQIDEVPPIVDIIETEKREPPIADIAKVSTAKIEEIESIEEPTLEEKDREIEEIPKVTLPIVPPEKEKLSMIKEEEIPEKVTVLTELPADDKVEKVQLEKEGLEILIVKDQILIVKAERTEITRIPAMPVDSQLTTQPYVVVDRRANIVKRELLHVIPVTKPSSMERSVSCRMQPPLQTTEIIEIARTNVAQTGQIAAQISTAKPPRTLPSVQIISEHLKPPELKASTEIAGDHPEITGRKMLWGKRLKDQSTVTTACAGSQTDKTSHVSHDRVERERARMPTGELLRSIKIAAGLTRGDTEREIRTINYGKRSDDGTRKAACDCCLCGSVASSASSVMPRLQVRPQTDAKIVTPQVSGFKHVFIPVKTDRLISRDRLCSDCKVKIQGITKRDKYHIEEIVKRISQDRVSRLSPALSTGKSHDASPQKRKKVEKRDQSCLAKIPKRKSDVAEQKKECDSPAIPVDTKKSDVKPLTPSCICFQLNKSGARPMRKGNCHCAD